MKKPVPIEPKITAAADHTRVAALWTSLAVAAVAPHAVGGVDVGPGVVVQVRGHTAPIPSGVRGATLFGVGSLVASLSHSVVQLFIGESLIEYSPADTYARAFLVGLTNTLYVAALGHLFGPNAERGIFRSTDGGQSFQRVLFKDANIGGNDVVRCVGVTGPSWLEDHSSPMPMTSARCDPRRTY